MDTEYQEVNTEEDVNHKKAHTKSILKQVFICSSLWTQFFVAGLSVGSTTVLIPQMRRESNATDIIDEEMKSWLYSAFSFGVIPWVIALPLFTKRVGRKIPQMITVVICIIIFGSMYFSTTPHHILISQSFQGYLHAGNVTVTVLIVVEYSSPKYRGLFLTIKSAGFFWGMWVANAIGTFYHWKNIAILGFVCSLSMLTVVFWPESPFWLASKGRFEECRSSFRWVHGLSAEKELRELIQNNEDDTLNKSGANLNWISVQSPEFYKPLVLSLMAVIQYHFSGKIVCTLFVLDIFKSITSSEGSAYTSMLILDGVTVVSMYIGTYLSKILKRRTLYMSSSFTAVSFLLAISLYLYLINLKFLEVNNYVILALLTVYSISISVGPMILSSSIFGELISTKFQASSYIIISLTFSIFYSVLVKLTPRMFSSLGLDGSFLLYGVASGLCTLYLYLFLPETKDRTQWEIVEYFKDKTRSRIAGEREAMSTQGSDHL